jgi:RNase H-like domain found in reverse transcriptase
MTQKAALAFKEIKQKIRKNRILHKPDFTKNISICTDASTTPLGGYTFQNTIKKNELNPANQTLKYSPSSLK